MRDDSIEISVEAIDQLVDGELPPERRRRLLLACERNPSAWRDVALAFLEAQAFSHSLATASAGASRRPTALADASPAKPSPVGETRDETRAGGTRFRIAAWATAMAIAFFFGWFAAHAWQGSATETKSGLPDLAVERPTVKPPGESDEGLSVYAMPGDAWARESAQSTADFNRWKREVESSGNHVEVRHRFVGLERDDGLQAIVPVNEVLVRPVSRITY